MGFKGFTIDLEGVRPMGVIASVPDGYYVAKITSIDDKENVAEGKRPGAHMRFVVTGPSHQGTPLERYMLYPLSKADEGDDMKSTRATWSSLLRSIHGDEKIAGAKKVKIEASSLVGKEITFLYQNPQTPEDKYPEITFVGRSQYEAAIAAGGAAPASVKPAGAKSNGQAGKVETTTAPAASGGKDALDDVLGL